MIFQMVLHLSHLLYITFCCSTLAEFVNVFIRLAVTVSDSKLVSKGGLDALHSEHTIITY